MQAVQRSLTDFENDFDKHEITEGGTYHTIIQYQAITLHAYIHICTRTQTLIHKFTHLYTYMVCRLGNELWSHE